MHAAFVKSITDLAEEPRGNKPHIALVGRSNAGKSSLVNHLTAHQGLARVSAAPGHTQTVNFYEIDRRWFLVDLPGYGFNKFSKARQAVFADIINDYLTNEKRLALAVLIIDARLGLTDADHLMRKALAAAKIPTVLVANKADKLTRAQLATFLKSVAETHPELKVIPHSTLADTGRGEILEEIDKALRPASKKPSA